MLARTTFGPEHERDIWTSSWPDYEDYRDGASSFASLVAMAPTPLDMTLEGAGEPERARMTWISPGFFGTLGERMAPSVCRPSPWHSSRLPSLGWP